MGIIYDRADGATIVETRCYRIEELHSIIYVITIIYFSFAEKWKLAGDKSGLGNTANIGSIQRIEDFLSGQGMFAKLGEECFDDYWMNSGKIIVKGPDGKTKRITSLVDFVKYRGGDPSLIVPRNNQP